MASRSTSVALVGAAATGGAFFASNADAFALNPMSGAQPKSDEARRLRGVQEQARSVTASSSGATVAPALATGAVLAAALTGARNAKGRRTPNARSVVPCSATAVAENIDVDTEAINAVRFLAVDAVNKANSGHPGAPMGQAPIGYVLWAEEMAHNPKNTSWVNRDRFVLSSGHGCMLQYSLLHLTGYESVTMDDLKQFRQWGSKTPGHPENFETDGIEVTTGPLGMGISNAVGLASAEAHLAAKYNKEGMNLIDHYTYCIMGDGCMQEGISHESCSLAGHLKLGKLIAFYDDNGITIDGHTDLSFTEDVAMRYEGYGWQVLRVAQGDTDVEGIRQAIAQAKSVTDKPTLIMVKTVIGYGSPNKADSHDAHGAPLGKEEAQATRDNLGWPYGEFEIPARAYETYGKAATRGADSEAAWQKTWEAYKEAHPELAAEFQRSVLDKKLPKDWEKCLPVYSTEDKGKATRINSQECLNAISPLCEEIIGGSADLAPSNMTLMKNTGDFLPGQYENRNMRFGIREFGMGAMCNAISLHKSGLVPYCATFLIFTDYMRNAIRMAALSQAGTIFVMTHDSIAVGEDGPTHQPIETVMSLRAIPGLTVIRPADGNETAGAYKVAVEKSKYESMPTLMALSRQALPNLGGKLEDVALGAYTLVDVEDPDVILIGTGSETHLCVDAAKKMSQKVKVVSMPSWELFQAQSAEYKETTLPKSVPKLSVEAGITLGWSSISDAQIGIDCFGASAPGGTCLEKFGFTVENVVACAERCIKGERGALSDGSGAH